jgi:hypothetical protein
LTGITNFSAVCVDEKLTTIAGPRRDASHELRMRADERSDQIPGDGIRGRQIAFAVSRTARVATL